VIVHGDYGFDNCLLGADGSVAAIVDWEVCTRTEDRSMDLRAGVQGKGL
jgi:aminoglycoside phosphotransferase (APT) family kinase protein